MVETQRKQTLTESKGQRLKNKLDSLNMKITQLQKHRTMKEECKTMSELRQIKMRNSLTVQNVREREEAKGANRPKPRSAGTEVANNIPVNCVAWNLSDKF